ncbi:MAG TPA: LysE family transporter, partial [Micromonosporaceae bacterium]|nr:LysE family transporter [Micromonosporaceae bacterium]
GYGVAVPVGAIAILIIGLTARTSLRVGVGAALGVATADGLYALLAVAGGAALASLIEPIATPMRWLAAAVLLVLAAHTAVTAVRHHRDPARAAGTDAGLSTPRRAYAGLLALTLLNPMTIVYFAALVLGRQAADGLSLAGEALFVTGAFLASASWQLVIAGSGSLVGRLLTGPRGRLATALASAALIVALAATTILSG